MFGGSSDCCRGLRERSPQPGTPAASDFGSSRRFWQVPQGGGGFVDAGLLVLDASCWNPGRILDCFLDMNVQ